MLFLSLRSFTHTQMHTVIWNQQFWIILTSEFANVAKGLGWGKLDLHCSNLPSGSQQKDHYPYQHLRAELWARVCRVTLTRLPTLQLSAGRSSPAESLQLLQPPVLYPSAMRCGTWASISVQVHAWLQKDLSVSPQQTTWSPPGQRLCTTY